MKESIFKAYDIRGIYPAEIDEEAAYKVGRALVRFLSSGKVGPAKTIVVGRDARKSSPALHAKLIEGITCEGADVVDIGVCTTPMLSFAVGNYHYDGGIMISASHNPKEFNAFKLIKSGPIMLDENNGLGEVKKIVEKGFLNSKASGTVIQKHILEDYVAHVLKEAEGIGPLSVVVDYGNGVGAISAKPVFARLGVKVKELYSKPDGTFPNHPANPQDSANFKELSREVLAQKADLGIFFDGDADRAIFVDEAGQIVPTDLLFIHLAKMAILKSRQKNVFFDIRSSKAVGELIKEFGGNPQVLRAGNPFLKEALKKKGGAIAAELTGHIIYPENFVIDDGLFAAVKVMQLLSKEKRPLSALIQENRIYETTPEVSLEAKNPTTVFNRALAALPKGKVSTIDGVYIDYPDGFVLIRKSNTENLFRFRAEAKTKEEMQKRLDIVTQVINS